MAEDEEHAPQDVEGAMSEDEIDRNMMETFPASDPPSWTLGIGPNHRSHPEAEEPDDDPPSGRNESAPES